ncbi:NAD(P)-binding protein [Auriculariales sp. MPI-PUGE-AT-0066]|nr:NAD(P)-binding protein [Auriculariales sp. MPI-PUGE-AT-0066]
MSLRKLLVVGGNGFVGSHVCKSALAHGWSVTSMSSSGAPFRTPAGHTPAWASSVAWTAANALQPNTYNDLIRGQNAVVHTIGTLLPSTSYKDAVRRADLPAVIGALLERSLGANPLKDDLYSTLNRDSALRVFETFAAENPTGERTFVFLSAADIFQPIIPARYIESKREAEAGLSQRAKDAGVRTVFIRPGLMYHAHQRPLTSPLAAFLGLSADIHHKLPASLPTPAGFLKSISLRALGSALETHPLHVEHVARAVCTSLEDSTIGGPVEVSDIRRLAGWHEDLGDGIRRSSI